MIDPVVDVILLDLPVPLWARAREHLRTALAELGAEDAAVRATELRQRLRDDFSPVAETAHAELRSANVRRLAAVDLAYPVPCRARADVDTYAAALDDLDACARAKGREDLVTPPECRSFWRWYLGEIAKQLDGGFPAPWPGD